MNSVKITLFKCLYFFWVAKFASLILPWMLIILKYYKLCFKSKTKTIEILWEYGRPSLFIFCFSVISKISFKTPTLKAYSFLKHKHFWFYLLKPVLSVLVSYLTLEISFFKSFLVCHIFSKFCWSVFLKQTTYISSLSINF